MITNLEVIKDNDIIRWVNKGRTYQNNLNHIDQCMVDEKRQLIFILRGCLSFPNNLDVLDNVGRVVFSSLPPEGSTFYYLTKLISHEVVVVCSFEKKVDNWYEWYYSFDPKSCELRRFGPAY